MKSILAEVGRKLDFILTKLSINLEILKKKKKLHLIWKKITDKPKKIRSFKMQYIIYIENSKGNLKNLLKSIRNQKNNKDQNITSWIQVNKIKKS